MELKQLEHFVAAADEQHFTRAARRMNIVQSGLSASIRALEQELGTSLFIRTTRRVELTAAGRVLYGKAQHLIANAREARAAVAAISGLERGSLSIGTCSSLNAFFDLSLLLGEFHAEHPGIEIRLCHSTATALMDKIKAGDMDVVFLPLFEKCRDIVTTPIAVVAGDHDEAILRKHTDYMASVIPGAKEIILPNASHFAMLQAPDEYSQAVLDFLDAK